MSGPIEMAVNSIMLLLIHWPLFDIAAPCYENAAAPKRERQNVGDEDLEYDGDAEADAEAGDEEATIPCPYCQRQVHEDSQRWRPSN